MSKQLLPAKNTFVAGKWMPSDTEALAYWLKKIMDKEAKSSRPLLPVIQEFKDFIESDPVYYMYFNEMFDEVPEELNVSPANLPQVRDYEHMLQLMNVIMTHAPEFDETGLVGFPFNAIFNWSMATQDGWSAFLNEKVNHHLKIILNEWAVFLQSKESASVLNEHPENGWFGEKAKQAMPTFVKDFQCDPTKPHYGFISWDDFFTRRFRDGVRPIASPQNDDVVINACESAPYCLATNIQPVDKFWLKAQPYALNFMLDNDEFSPHFVGGTVYQAFLSALSYHRWHAPVSGRIVKTRIIEGTYYSEAISQGRDESAPNASQGYITEIATRGLIFIEADNKDIGLMCFMAVGMAEVSTCDIRVYEGQYVNKGDELGMFHFGGSTHCLFFSKDVNLEFDLHGQKPGLQSHNIPVNAQIAIVKPRNCCRKD
ncbi:phosphatidylserine decarboxylase family protein [Enterobacter hormaechei]|uniref:phosphatidylserine decarboxylase family protein n=1 Tax=Enterobacter hormaechei TaxID=158836 RepID=UPI0039E580D7